MTILVQARYYLRRPIIPSIERDVAPVKIQHINHNLRNRHEAARFLGYRISNKPLKVRQFRLRTNVMERSNDKDNPCVDSFGSTLRRSRRRQPQRCHKTLAFLPHTRCVSLIRTSPICAPLCPKRRPCFRRARPQPYPYNFHETDGLSRNPNDCAVWGCIRQQLGAVRRAPIRASLRFVIVTFEAAAKRAADGVRRCARHDHGEHKSEGSKGLSSGNVLCDRDRASHVVSSAVFRVRGQDAWLPRFYGVHAARPPVFHSAPDFAGRQSARLRRDHVPRKKLAQARRHFPGRSGGVEAVQHRPQQHSPDHHRGRSEPLSLLGGAGRGHCLKAVGFVAVVCDSSLVSSLRFSAQWRLRGAKSTSTARFWRATFSRASFTANGFTRCRCRRSSL